MYLNLIVLSILILHIDLNNQKLKRKCSLLGHNARLSIALFHSCMYRYPGNRHLGGMPPFYTLNRR